MRSVVLLPKAGCRAEWRGEVVPHLTPYEYLDLLVGFGEKSYNGAVLDGAASPKSLRSNPNDVILFLLPLALQRRAQAALLTPRQEVDWVA